MEVEAGDVEHRLVRIAGVVGLQPAQVAAEVDVAVVEADGPSALELPDALHAPPADQRVGESAGAAAPVLLASKWQLPDTAEHQPVRDVELG